MALWEVLCALWVFSVVGTSAAVAWSTVIQCDVATDEAVIADDCAQDTAERMYAHVATTREYTVEGKSCVVEVYYNQGPNHQEIHIVATCGQACQDLWLAET